MARKHIKMVVEVSCPSWLTAAQARKEVRTLLNSQCFYGHAAGFSHKWEDIDETNFRARSVRPCR